MLEPPDATLSLTVGRRGGAAARPLPQLFVVFPAGRLDAGASRHVLLHVDRVDIGRGAGPRASRATVDGIPTVSLALDDGRVSSRHCSVVRVGDRWRLEDRGSKNGTFLNGRRCTEAVLRDGDVLGVGHTSLLFRDEVPVDPFRDADGPAHPAVAGAPEWSSFHEPLLAEYRRLAQLAPRPVPVLVTGEPGTGKEVVARVLHRLSRRTGQLVAVNCGAIPESLAEAELFGAKRGAFTGAAADRPGWVRSADRGTLFLDEIGELPMVLQAKLLRVLEMREVLPVGADAPVAVDFRLVSATNRDLDAAVEAGTFRADLRGRLGALTVELPPLRARREDLGLLAPAMAARALPEGAALPRLAAEAAVALLRSEWRGNVRDLAAAMAQAVALAADGQIELEHLPPSLAAPEAAPAAEPSPADPESAARRAELEALLREARGNVAEVARRLGKHRELVYRALERYGLEPALYRRGPGES